MRIRLFHRLRLMVGFGLVIGWLWFAGWVLAEEGIIPAEGGYYYIVRPGDSWSSISWYTGIPVAELKALNPTIVHPHDWLWVGDRLFIPWQPTMPPKTDQISPQGYWYQVKEGDSWYSVARDTGVSVGELWRANPLQLRANRWLYAGRWIWIPAPPPMEMPAAAGPISTATQELAPEPQPRIVVPGATPQPATRAAARPTPQATPTEVTAEAPVMLRFETPTPKVSATPVAEKVLASPIPTPTAEAVAPLLTAPTVAEVVLTPTTAAIPAEAATAEAALAPPAIAEVAFTPTTAATLAEAATAEATLAPPAITEVVFTPTTAATLAEAATAEATLAPPAIAEVAFTPITAATPTGPTTPAATQPSQGRRVLLIGLAVVAAAGLAGAGVWWYRRR